MPPRHSIRSTSHRSPPDPLLACPALPVWCHAILSSNSRLGKPTGYWTPSPFQGLARLARAGERSILGHIDLKKDPDMKRRTFLQGGAIGVAGLSMTPALAHYKSNGRHPTPEDLGASVTRLRKQFLEDFDAAYVDNVIVPHFLVSTYHGERPSLPMIDVTLSKENALPNDLWGMLSETWRPNPEQGVPSFCRRWRNGDRTIAASAST